MPGINVPRTSSVRPALSVVPATCNTLGSVSVHTTGSAPAEQFAAPGTVLEIRDETWLVQRVERASDGWFVEVQGLSELVRGTHATFSSAIDDITPLDPAFGDGEGGHERAPHGVAAVAGGDAAQDRRSAHRSDGHGVDTGTRRRASLYYYQRGACRIRSCASSARLARRPPKRGRGRRCRCRRRCRIPR